MERHEYARDDDAYLLAAREPGFGNWRVEIGLGKGRFEALFGEILEDRAMTMVLRFARRTIINSFIICTWLLIIAMFWSLLNAERQILMNQTLRSELVVLGFSVPYFFECFAVGVAALFMFLWLVVRNKVRLSPEASTQEMLIYFCIVVCLLGFSLGLRL